MKVFCFLLFILLLNNCNVYEEITIEFYDASVHQHINQNNDVFCIRFQHNDQFYIQAVVKDPQNFIDEIKLSGDEIDGNVNLTYNLYPDKPGEWWTNPNVYISTGTIPNFPLTYTFEILLKDGSNQSITKTVSDWDWNN